MRGKGWSMIEWPGIQVFLDRYPDGRYEGEGWLMIGKLTFRVNFYQGIGSATLSMGWR